MHNQHPLPVLARRFRGLLPGRSPRPLPANAVPLLACALLFAPAPRATADVISQLTDPEQLSVEAPLDIRSARIEQTGGRLTFVIQTRGDIPTSLPLPDDTMTYLWLLDTDENPATGQPHGELGSEFNVRAVIGQTYGGGFVDVTGAVPGGGTGTVTVNGRTISIQIWLTQVGTPADFSWRCASFHMAGGQWVSGNPETSIADAVTLPYAAPAHVAVTTPLLALSPSGPATGQLAVEIRDANGQVLPNAEHVLAFHSTNEAVATVSGTGLVTALRPPAQHWETPYIEVWADGLMADNAAVIRVTTTDLGVEYQMYPEEHVSFYLPPAIEGVDLHAITTSYEVVPATERAYEAQAEGVGEVPVRGGRQYLVLDVTDDPVTCVCGASGNPVRLGWLWGQPVHNSCYIVNDPQNRVPQWFVMFHELGHNFTCACNSFNLFCMGPSPVHNTAYGEGLASLAAMWSWQSIRSDPGGLGALARADIDRQFTGTTNGYRQRLADYQNAGANYDAIDPDIVDGILCEMMDAYGLGAWWDLFSTFLPSNEPLPLPLDTREKQATWLVAAMSTTAGADLRPLFRTEYGFPIDDAAWTQILGAVAARIDARPWTQEAIADPGPAAAAPDRILTAAPNPFTTRTAVRLALGHEAPAALAIYDASGRLVTTLLDQVLPAGEHLVAWDGRDAAGHALPSGAYFVRLATTRGTGAQKLILLR